MTDTNAPVNYAAIEIRARQLRAEAAREGVQAIRRAFANAFASLSLRGTKAA